ncbi:MAG: SdrD B-like domain-containing protein, partial [Gemmatimonadota bacterium]
MTGALLSAPIVLHAQQSIRNIPYATYVTPFGIDSVSVTTPGVPPVIFVRPQVGVTMTLLSAPAARAGDTVQYRINYTNTSSLAAITGLVLVDSLPAGLNFAAAVPSATPLGRTVRWTLPNLAPSASAEVLLTLTVAAGLHDTLRVRNVVTLTPGNAPSQVGTAAELTLSGTLVASIALTQAADVLEVGLGDIAPFTLVVKNNGAAPLTDLRIHVTLPAGMSYSKGSATGVDSVSLLGSTLSMHLAGTLAGGATRTVHYNAALVSASGTALQNVAYATDAATQARSADAIAFVQVRAAMPMEDRAVIGKVWVDANNNGVQDAGEAGLVGLEIWTDDGEIATSDSAGRFSYHNVRPGRHGFRLDPASVPAGYRLADGGMVTVDATGWTTPRVDFRLLPTAGTV